MIGGMGAIAPLGFSPLFLVETPTKMERVAGITMQRFLDREGPKSRGMEHFDAWAATFGEVVDTMEITPDGAGLRPRSRFAHFTNLPELQQMFRAFFLLRADGRDAEPAAAPEASAVVRPRGVRLRRNDIARVCCYNPGDGPGVIQEYRSGGVS